MPADVLVAIAADPVGIDDQGFVERGIVGNHDDGVGIGHIAKDITHADGAGSCRGVGRDGGVGREGLPGSPVVVLTAAPEDEVGERLALPAVGLGGASAGSASADAGAVLTSVVLGS